MPSSPQKPAFKSYALLTGLVWAGTIIVVLALNCLVDPLWYFQGNRLTHKNFAFNERQAKLNQLLRAPGQYDCLIFGSSRTTLLSASAFSGYRCFNLSFSGGQVEDFIAYAEYLEHLGMRPKLIIVGVDGFNFLRSGRDAPTIPEYVLKKLPPPGFLKTYLSIDSLRMTWRTIRGSSKMPRYYDDHFEVLIRKDAPRFRPEKSLEGEGLRRADTEERKKRTYWPDNAVLYAKLVSVFPDARAIGYVPPISAWHISDMEKNGVLGGYIDALANTAPIFREFIDFSVPSPITSRTDITYDGSHYHPSVNLLIARALQSDTSPDWGVDMKQIGDIDLAQRYQMALDAFRSGQAGMGPPHFQHD
jgi:hypothetical protein